MNTSTSLYLDFLRVISAFSVLLVHANLPWFSSITFLPPETGHDVVMIFFVLSGYLIAFTVQKKEPNGQIYLVDRLSRLYSVVLPALVLTYILDYTGNFLNPTFYSKIVAFDHAPIRFLLNASFLSQIWGLSTKPSSNGPFWSVTYEFWYYMLFGAFYYLSGKKRYLVLASICVLVGLKILLLLPVWLFGVLAFYAKSKVNISKITARLIFVFTTLLLMYLTFFCDHSIFSSKVSLGAPPLYFSAGFAFDWGYGVLVALNIFAVSFLDYVMVVPEFVQRAIKNISSMTFSLYLYHYPLLVFIAAILSFNKSNVFIVLLVISVIVIIVSLLSIITEKKRGNWKLLFGNLISFVLMKKKPVRIDA